MLHAAMLEGNLSVSPLQQQTVSPIQFCSQAAPGIIMPENIHSMHTLTKGCSQGLGLASLDQPRVCNPEHAPPVQLAQTLSPGSGASRAKNARFLASPKCLSPHLRAPYLCNARHNKSGNYVHGE